MSRETNRSAREFKSAQPFPNLVIDDFLEPELCRGLAAEFPAYDHERFRNAYGHLGKAVHTNIRELGPAFRRFDETASSRAFLDRLSRLTGIEGLLYDPSYVGAGAQENVPGMEILPHVDFNRLSKRPWRRRLNFFVYLNEGWRPECGGSLVLHSDPESSRDKRKRIEPLFNRCAIFATSERSWHSVEPVLAGPAGAPQSRRSLSLYFYTDLAREKKIPARHLTIFAYPGLPRSIKAGGVLDQAAIDAVNRALALRDTEAIDYGGLKGASRTWRSPLPDRWRAGLRLTDEDVKWIRMELAARDFGLDILRHPPETGAS